MNAHDRILAWWFREPPRTPDTPDAWRERTEAACRRALAGLVLETARRHNRTIPHDCLIRLRTTAMAVAADNLHRFAELENIIGAFHAANVPVMLLKGAALWPLVYAHPQLRPMSDVDLLIEPQNVDAARKLLARQGCRQGFDLIREDFFPRYYYETEYHTASVPPVRIDLHVRPFRPMRLSQTMSDHALWEGAKPIHIGNVVALVPRLESLLIHLAGHAAFHGCDRLIWLYDIKRLGDGFADSIDWNVVTQTSQQWKLSAAVLHAFRCTTEMLGEPCPRHVMDELARHPSSWADRLVLRQAPRDAATPLTHVLVNFLTTPGFRVRFGYLAALLSPGRKHLAELYPYRHAGWPACAHLWRLGRLCRRAVRATGSALRHATRHLQRVAIGDHGFATGRPASRPVRAEARPRLVMEK